MKNIVFTKVENRVDYLSIEGNKAISAHGELFTVGDEVRHDDKTAGTALIQKFTLDIASMDVIAHTDQGTARICFISKLKEEDL